MSRPEQLDYQLYSDHVHTAHIPHRRRPLSTRPATVVNGSEQRAWIDGVESVVRYELNRLECDRRVNVEGVLIQRTSAYSKHEYFLNGEKTRYTFSEAVAAVVAAARAEVAK